MFIYPQSKDFVEFISSKQIRIRKLKIVYKYLTFLKNQNAEMILQTVLGSGLPKEVCLVLFGDYLPCQKYFKFVTTLQCMDSKLMDIPNYEHIEYVFPKLKCLEIQLSFDSFEIFALLTVPGKNG
ncbi:unnamed protein product [Ambrosiozyma monospora]|uniref:Unnamed protein product n=1 Tax=Ambrosiozyma monospora TaxID=43982 RepID=A0ACB5SZC1_AMBMO|nr:unnamed protein product [Ambrosiozyma monospora]